ncbi:MAG TPA: hypothetical protein VIR78_01075 [Malonomonas sp.]
MQYRFRCFTLFISLFGVLYATAALAIPATMTLGYDTDLGSSGIQNSHPHNLSSGSSGSIHAPLGGEDELCKFCHTPHGGTAAGPLWNRIDPIGPNADGTFPLYTGAAALKAIPAAQYTAAIATDASLYPNGATRLCLSCHDGVTAVGEVISGGTLANLTMSAFGTIDLSTSHPVSFTYTEAVRALLPGSYSRPAPGSIVKLDGAERMQCTTCHDPHNDTNTGGAYTLPMWRLYTGTEADDYNNTCLTCHNVVPGVGSLH